MVHRLERCLNDGFFEIGESMAQRYPEVEVRFGVGFGFTADR